MAAIARSDMVGDLGICLTAQALSLEGRLVATDGATSIVVAILMKSAYCKWALEHALALEWYCSSLRHYASNH